ncbi:MAG: MBOAT family O-acyltransferase [Anaerolineales bacterium]
MSFTTHAFLLLFLPLTFLAYYKLFKTPRRKTFFLLAVSYGFYALAGWQFIPVLLGLSLLTFLAAKKNWFLPGILLNLGALALFKYWNFGVDNFNALTSFLRLGVTLKLLSSLGLPLGISFFVFKHIGYLLDVQAKRYPASPDLVVFLTFSAYFPQISAGPISSFKDTATQFLNLPERLENGQALNGLVHLSMGLAKKVLIADQIGILMDASFSKQANFAGIFPAWYMVIAYAVQLYFDFSGYTDMALGISALLGVKLPPNFNSPYLASDPAEFWERWHMSLSNWFRTYLFSPLSRSLLRKWGSDKREWAQYAANFITMSLVGFWHGASWAYLLWGLYHGLLLNLGAAWKRTGRKLPVLIGRSLLVFAILLGWALFMSPNAAFLQNLFAGLFGLKGLGNPAVIGRLVSSTATLAILAGIPLAFSGRSEAASLFKDGQSVSVWKFFFWGVLAAICILLIGQAQDFIYAGF